MTSSIKWLSNSAIFVRLILKEQIKSIPGGNVAVTLIESLWNDNGNADGNSTLPNLL